MNQPIQEYLRNKHKLEQTFFNITNGVGNYYPRVTPIPKKEYEDWYPLGGKVTLWNFNEKGPNPDKKRVV
jgi:hypothetical protein